MKDHVEIAGARVPDDFSYAARELSQAGNQVRTLDALRRRWRLIVSVVAATSLVAYLLCHLMTPLYSATATVMIDPLELKREAPASGQLVMPPSEETIRKNEIAIIRSRSLAQAVIVRLALDSEPEFNPALRPNSSFKNALERVRSTLIAWSTMMRGPHNQDRAASGTPEEQALERVVDTFLERLSMPSSDASRIIEIRYSSEGPVRAAQIANTIADQYISLKLDEELAATRATARDLSQDIEVLGQKIYEAERTIANMRKEHGVLPTVNIKVASDQLAELNRQYVAATGERVQAAGRLAELQAVRGSPAVDSASAVLNSPLIQRLQGEVAILTARIGDMSTTLGESHPRITRARAELRDLRTQIDAEVAKIAGSYRSAFAVAEAKETSLRQKVEELRTQVAQTDASEVDVRALERKAEANRSLLTQLVAKLNDAKVQLHAKNPQAVVTSKATTQRVPSFPPKVAIMAVSLIFSATGGTILAMVLERRDASVRSTSQIREVTSTRVLGAIPTVKRARRKRLSPQAQVLSKRRSLFVENLRGVWLQIYSSRETPGNIVLITSSVSGEGKSSVAACLARMLAQAGRRTAILDGDLRNPSVHRALGLSRLPGLAELVVDEASLYDVLQVDEASGAYCITAGAAVASPSDLLQTARLAQVLRELSAEFDVVIIDSPPILAVHDALILAKQADVTIMVVRWGKTRITAICTALQRMFDLSIPVEGIVLTMVDSRQYRLYGFSDAEIFSPGLRKYYHD